MNLYYNVPLNMLTNSEGNILQTVPQLAYGENPEITFSAFTTANTPLDLSEATTWHLAVDIDRANKTKPVIDVPASGISYDASANVLNYSMDTRTLEFFSAVDGKTKVSLIAELSGYNANGTRIFRFFWNMVGVMSVAGTPGLPPQPSSVYAEYTSFEVYATNTDIPAGTVDEVTGLEYSVAVPAGMTHRMVLKTTVHMDDAQKADVVVDWGDGTQSILTDAHEVNDRWEAKKQIWYIMRHTYAVPGRYVVTLKGHNYYGVQHSSSENCLCRAFTDDLPVASCVINLSNFCNGALKLQQVHVPSGFLWHAKYANCYGIFYGCKNLLTATGLTECFMYSITVKEMFNDCRNMNYTDFVLPVAVFEFDGRQRVFRNCYRLAADISTLFPVNGFAEQQIMLKDTFSNCVDLMGTVPAAKLWEDTSKQWIEAEKTFNSLSDDLKAQIPTSWGGTMEWLPEPAVEVVDVLPESPDANTIYFVKGQ